MRNSQIKGVLQMIGKKIRDLRICKGLSQIELGLVVGKRSDVICKIEKGTRRVTADEVPLFAKALDVSSSYLLDNSQVKLTSTEG